VDGKKKSCKKYTKLLFYTFLKIDITKDAAQVVKLRSKKCISMA
jgi:hypothetical protein